MSHLPLGVPDLGAPQQLIIPDVRIVVPNIITISGNGLDVGHSIGHLQVTAPTQGKQWRVPFTGPQALEIVLSLQAILADNHIHTTQERANHD